MHLLVDLLYGAYRSYTSIVMVHKHSEANAYDIKPADVKPSVYC